jgi:hypothetical protein
VLLVLLVLLLLLLLLLLLTPRGVMFMLCTVHKA